MVSHRQIGKRQLRYLRSLASPDMFLIVSGPVIRSLLRRGLVKAFGDDGDSFFGITPAGLRILADALEAGRVVQELPKK